MIDRAKAPWMNAELLNEKRVKRRLERRWRNTGLEVDKIAFKHQKKLLDKLLRDVHTDYLSKVISENASDPKTLFKCIDSLVGSKKKNPLPEPTPEIKLAESFSDFFLKKITDIHKNIANRPNVAQPLIIEERRYNIPLTDFKEISEQEVRNIIQKSPKKCCLLDPLPTFGC